MEIEVQAMPSTQRREPWNKGKAHRPETTAAAKTCWSIRTRLPIEGRTRDLAMFNLAIDANHGTALRQSWTAKGKQGFNFIVGQGEIKDFEAVSHMSDICCTGEGQHPKLESETIDYLRNRLIIMVGNLGHAWFQESLPISRKQGKRLIDDIFLLT